MPPICPSLHTGFGVLQRSVLWHPRILHCIFMGGFGGPLFWALWTLAFTGHIGISFVSARAQADQSIAELQELRSTLVLSSTHLPASVSPNWGSLGKTSELPLLRLDSRSVDLPPLCAYPSFSLREPGFLSCFRADAASLEFLPTASRPSGALPLSVGLYICSPYRCASCLPGVQVLPSRTCPEAGDGAASPSGLPEGETPGA